MPEWLDLRDEFLAEMLCAEAPTFDGSSIVCTSCPFELVATAAFWCLSCTSVPHLRASCMLDMHRTNSLHHIQV